MSLEQDEVSGAAGYVALTVISVVRFVVTFAFSGLIYWIGGGWANISMDLGTVWEIPNDVPGGLRAAYLLFIWGVVITTAVGILNILGLIPRTARPGIIFARGTWISLHAGFFEELIWRWLLLLSAPVLLKLLNVVTFGLVRWMYGDVLVPLANWFTLGLLEPQLTNANWLVGAAIISVNGHFRRQHEAGGLVSFVNAWFVGMVLFYLLFNYGIWTAIVAHILYDVCVMWTAATLANWQRPGPNEYPYHYRY